MYWPRKQRISAPTLNYAGSGKLKIVVLGMGFAATSFIRSFRGRLSRNAMEGIEVFVISSKSYSLFSPLLYEVATGQVYEYHIATPFSCEVERKGFKFIEADVNSIDVDNKEVVTSRGIIEYDILIVALGSESNDFGIEGVKDNAISLKTLSDGKGIRNRILESYEDALLKSYEGREYESLLNFVVVGGGATGIELSAALVEFLDEIDRSHGKRDLKHRVILIESKKGLIEDQGKEFSKKLERILRTKGVELFLGKSVVKITREEVFLSDGGIIPSKNVFWTAGIRPNRVLSTAGDNLVKGKGGRLVVTEDLSVPYYKNVYVIGDAALPPPSEKGEMIPQTASAAVQQGKFLGKILADRLNGHASGRKFSYREHGTFLSIGRSSGLCKLPSGIILSGISAWAMWRFIHLLKISSIENKLEILTDWFLTWLHKGIFVGLE